MGAARRVIPEVRRPHLRRVSIPEQVKQHDDVGLLDDARALDPFAAKQHVDRGVPRLEGREVDVFQAEIAPELLDQTGGRIEARIEFAGDLLPPAGFVRIEPDPLGEIAPALRPALGQEPRGGGSALQVPARHAVGVGVVVDALVVFVGTDDAADVPQAVVSRRRAARPEARRLQQDLRARLKQEALVTGRPPVAPDAVGDVRADVLFLVGQTMGVKRPSGASTNGGVTSSPVSADSQA